MVAELLGPVAVYWPFLLSMVIIMSTVALVRRWQGWDDQIKEEPWTRSNYLWYALSSVAGAALCSWMVYVELHKPRIAWIWLAFLLVGAFLKIFDTGRSLRKARELSA